MSSLHFIGRRIVRANIVAAALFFAACSGENPSDPGPQNGSLVVTVSGLPSNASANVTVTGPAGFSRTVTATTTLTQLPVGTYTVVTSDVTHEGSTYTAAISSQSWPVAAGATVTVPDVNYALATGGLSVSLSGLPQSANATILISGPDGYTRTLAAATDIVGLKPGAYLIDAPEVQLTSARYAATPGTQQVVVAASLAPSVASIAYALSTGSLQINISGLPQGAAAAVTIAGPGNYSRSITAETVIDNLVPGSYSVTASTVTAGGASFGPAPPAQQVAVQAGQLPAVANVFYTSTGTSLDVRITGLPGNVGGAVTVSGPNGYTRQLTASQLLTSLAAGNYTVSAAAVTASCATYSPSPPSQTVPVTPGLASPATVNYGTGGGVNLCIDGAYITQAVQAFDNSVPLVAGRDGLLRVFVRASTGNSVQPAVRVRFYNAGGTLVNTVTIPAPTASVATTIDEATLGSTWNAPIAGTVLQPGLRMLVDVDPSNAIAESSEADNLFPTVGTPVALDVRVVSPLNVTMVPIIQAVRGDTARLSEANKASFILPMQRMFPVATVNADIHTPYTYSGAELQSGGGNWTALLSEMNVLRVAEATGRLYYGMVRVGYTSGVAGLGYIGVPAALGWDHQPSGTEVMAHELGHNFGRLHAPCGGPAGVDGSYPYSGAEISVFGYDIFSGQLKFPALRDLMSYCNPPWISDYTYKAILNFRSLYYPATSAATTASSTQKGLLVWGRIEEGRLVLEPGIEVDAPASLPRSGGPHRVEGFGASGETLFSLSFSGDRVADAPDANDQTFAFVVPMSQLRGVDLSRLRFSALGRQVEQRGSGGGAVPSAQRTSPGRVRVSWNSAAARIALVRDARSGRILSIGRGGSVDLQTPSDDLEITLSDGVKSTKSRIRPK